MGKNCLAEYLTPHCANCPDWADGTDDRGIGCATHYPIMWCEHFAAMCKEEAEREKKCKNCACYDKSEKACGITGKHTARKSKCEKFCFF